MMAAPDGTVRYWLFSIGDVGNWRSYQSGACVNLPDFFTDAGASKAMEVSILTPFREAFRVPTRGAESVLAQGKAKIAGTPLFLPG